MQRRHVHNDEAYSYAGSTTSAEKRHGTECGNLAACLQQCTSLGGRCWGSMVSRAQQQGSTTNSCSDGQAASACCTVEQACVVGSCRGTDRQQQMRASFSLRHDGSGQGLCRTLAAYGAATCRAPHLLVSIFACGSVAAVLLTLAALPFPCRQLQVQRPGQPRRHRGCGRRQRRRGDQQEQQEGGLLPFGERADWNRPLLRRFCWGGTIVSSVLQEVGCRDGGVAPARCMCEPYAAGGAQLTSAPCQLLSPAMQGKLAGSVCKKNARRTNHAAAAEAQSAGRPDLKASAGALLWEAFRGACGCSAAPLSLRLSRRTLLVHAGDWVLPACSPACLHALVSTACSAPSRPAPPPCPRASARPRPPPPASR